MKCKITTGGGMRGLLKYQNKPGAEFIAGSQQNERDFLRETAALRSLRPDCRKPVLHVSLSLPDGEKLDAAQWEAATNRFLEKMELSENSFFAVRHSDSAHDHIHLAINMIGSDGSRWNSQKSALRAQQACIEIEQEFQLQRTRTLAEFREEEGHRRRIVRDGATNEFRRTGKVKSKVERAIQKRKAVEKNGKQDRATHQQTSRSDGLLEQGRTTNPAKNAPAGKANPRPAAPDQGAGIPTDRPAQPAPEIVILEAEGWLSSATRPEVPTLSGRLEAIPTPGANGCAFDLHWKGRDLPTFRYLPASGELQLIAQPNRKNVEALLDTARDMKPPLRVFGSADFQIEVCRAARLRGLAVEPENEHIRAEHRIEIRREEIRLADERAERERAAEAARVEFLAARDQAKEEDRMGWQEHDEEEQRLKNSPRPPAHI